MFVIIDGIDGCGKGTIVQALAERRRRAGANVFDLRAYTARERRLPTAEEIVGYEVVTSGEPTYAWVGGAIRDEMIRDNGRNYSTLRTAEAFALDRHLLYRRVLLPLRARGIDIFQERSVTSSLMYQRESSADNRQPLATMPGDPLTDGVPIDALCVLEGNALALSNPPDLCIILSVEPHRAMQRLQLRQEKQDAAIFEKLPILERFHERYHSAWFRDLLTKYGWRVEYLDANGAVEDAVARALRLLETLKPQGSENDAMRRAGPRGGASVVELRKRAPQGSPSPEGSRAREAAASTPHRREASGAGARSQGS